MRYNKDKFIGQFVTILSVNKTMGNRRVQYALLFAQCHCEGACARGNLKGVWQ